MKKLPNVTPNSFFKYRSTRLKNFIEGKFKFECESVKYACVYVCVMHVHLLEVIDDEIVDRCGTLRMSS